jgi:formyltetrahydrofolate deformylase
VANAVLLLSCPDQPGIVAAVSAFVYEHGGNIVRAQQHIDAEDDVFFQRVEFDLDGLDLGREEIGPAFARVADRFDMSVDLRFTDAVTRMAVLVSKQAHCLDDLLSRHRMGDFGSAEIPIVISNHPDHAATAAFAGSAFAHLPVTPETKRDQEAVALALLAEHRIDLVVLARYMQVLSDEFIDAYRNCVINIHHSFLPAFLGARPYHQAHERGVKLIGATAHYASEELDEGPIIEQDVLRVSHQDVVEDLVRSGRDLERVVLARAVRAHLHHRVLPYGRRTVVFD